MSQETADTSQSGEKPKKKKKYLYLDKFETYKESTDNRLTVVERSQLRIVFILAIVGLACAAAAIIYGFAG